MEPEFRFSGMRERETFRIYLKDDPILLSQLDAMQFSDLDTADKLIRSASDLLSTSEGPYEGYISPTIRFTIGIHFQGEVLWTIFKTKDGLNAYLPSYFNYDDLHAGDDGVFSMSRTLLAKKHRLFKKMEEAGLGEMQDTYTYPTIMLGQFSEVIQLHLDNETSVDETIDKLKSCLPNCLGVMSTYQILSDESFDEFSRSVLTQRPKSG